MGKMSKIEKLNESIKLKSYLPYKYKMFRHLSIIIRGSSYAEVKANCM